VQSNELPPSTWLVAPTSDAGRAPPQHHVPGLAIPLNP